MDDMSEEKSHIIPTSKYFEVRFDHMQTQIDDLKVDLKDFRYDMDKRFEQIIASIDRLGDKLDHRDENQRAFTLRMFTIARRVRSKITSHFRISASGYIWSILISV